ncbi:MAG TPA: FGGY-family carbohydrate kinase, partial [Pirellulaceae bacterium]
NDTLMQFQSDILGIPLYRPQVAETTGLGAADLAGLAVGYWQDQSDVARIWFLDREFVPRLSESERHRRYDRWREAVARVRDWDRS